MEKVYKKCIDELGRIVIPKAVRVNMDIEPRDVVVFTYKAGKWYIEKGQKDDN